MDVGELCDDDAMRFALMRELMAAFGAFW